MNKELKDRQNVVEYLARTLSEPLDFNLVISSVTSAESKKDLTDNLLAIFDLEDPNFSEKFTVVQYYAAALGARAGNPKRLRKDEIISEFDLDGRKINFKQSLNILRDRVAVPKTYYEDLPKELRAMSFYVSGLEKLREVEIIQNSLGNAINKGYSFKEWKDRLDFDGLKNLSDARLETVFRNNTNTVYNQSMRFNAGTSDVTPYLMYSAVGDSDTRPSHQQLDGIIKRADSVFWDKFTAPLDHNCTSFEQLVSGDFVKGFRSFYKGDMVCVYLKSGKTISGVTLNHPVMTSEGFIHAKDLNVGDKVATNFSEVKRFNASWNVNYYNIAPTASNVFKSMFLKAFSVFKSTSFNFYGDIEFMNKEIDVVTPDRFLSSDSKSIFNVFKNFIFKFSNHRFLNFLFPCVGSFFYNICFNIIFIKNFCNVSFRNAKSFRDRASVFFTVFIEINNVFFNLFNIFSKKFLLRKSSRFVTKNIKPSTNRVSANTELLAKFVNAHSFIEGFDEIIDIKFYPYIGFVYDFESSHGLVITEDFITSNCRCGLINLTEEEAQDMGISTRSVGSFKNIDMFDEEKESGYGDFLSSSKNAAQRAVDNRPDKDPFKSSFQNSLNKVDQKVDIWWEGVKNIFEEQ